MPGLRHASRKRRHVAANPYEKAAAGLKQLKELGELQEGRKTIQEELATASQVLRQHIATLAAFVVAKQGQETHVGQYLAGLPTVLVGSWWDDVYPMPAGQEIANSAKVLTLDQILATVDFVAAQDAASVLAVQERQHNIAERDSLNALVLLVQAQDAKRTQHVDGLVAAQARGLQYQQCGAYRRGSPGDAPNRAR